MTNYEAQNMNSVIWYLFSDAGTYVLYLNIAVEFFTMHIVELFNSITSDAHT